LFSLLLLFMTGCDWFDGDGDGSPSSDNRLASLTVSEGVLSPAFTITATQYSVEVSNEIESIQITATLQESSATIQINGVVTASGSPSAAITLAVGSNAILIVGTAENGQSRTVTINVNRSGAEQSNDANLSGLSLSEGSLGPVFSAQNLTYSASVINSTNSITLTPTASDMNASITVNGTSVASGTASNAISLGVGLNTINIVVTAEDTTSIQTYVVDVTRDAALSSDADLSNLSLSSGSLSPTFDAATLAYSASVDFATSAITVTATLADSAASVTVDGIITSSGSASHSISLNQGSNSITLVVLAEDGLTTQTYTLTVARQAASNFAQQAYLKASNTEANDRFGYKIAISGNTLVVGAFIEDSSATGIDGQQNDNSASNSGAVYVFTRDSSSVWSQQAYLKASNTGAGDFFGSAVAVSGNTIVVGASSEDSDIAGQNNELASSSGAAYVFTRVGTTWSQQAFLKASNAETNDVFGVSVAISGNTIAIGAQGEDSSATGVNGDMSDNSAQAAGAVYIFGLNESSNWIQQAYLKASNSNANDGFGTSVALENDNLIVGSTIESSNARGVNGDELDNSSPSSGAVYVFTRLNNVWSQQAYLKASNTGAGDYFGGEVSISNNTVAVSAFYESSNAVGIDGDQSNDLANKSGAVYIFVRDNSNQWSQQAYLKASNTEAGDEFGRDLALFGNNIAVGAWTENGGAVGIDGDQSNNSQSNAGAVYFYSRAGVGSWNQQQYIKASNSESGDLFGMFVALDGTTLVVSSQAEDSNATGIDGNQGNNSAGDSGAVYLFNTQ